MNGTEVPNGFMTKVNSTTRQPSRSKELIPTLYKCSVHDVWLTLRTVHSLMGTFTFWQCPKFVFKNERSSRKGHGKRCQTCKPCKGRVI